MVSLRSCSIGAAGRAAARPAQARPHMPARRAALVLPRVQAARLLRAAAVEAPTAPLPTPALEAAAAQLAAAPDARARLRLLTDAARSAPPMPEGSKRDANRVMGCTSQAWVAAELDAATDTVRFFVDSDAELTRGMAALLAAGLSGLTPEQVEEVDAAALQAALQLGPEALTRSRANGFLSIVEAMKKRARALRGELPSFPSLLISRSGLEAQGSFAQAQVQFLRPDPAAVGALVGALSSKKVGVVAHFYMDPQVQGVLSSAAERWPHIRISDSLVMADGAVAMAAAGCTSIAVLGVDFMSENVRAILDEAGYADVAVHRMDAGSIGCSLAEAAEAPAYDAYLSEASQTPNSLHVVYINTSLRTKALAHEAVPTITCTSSNVVQTVLQAFAQVPGATVWYGPDTYMGANLASLLRTLSTLPDEDVAALHPAHSAASVAAALPRLRYFDQGTCIVHHLFGGEVCELVRRGYRDAYLAAHFEVPGEMFELAMEARRRGMGVVGSTQNILDFIAARLGEALERPFPDRLQFVLGTEAGMITSIVRKVQAMLGASGRDDVAVEIVFPVSPDAITTERQQSGGAPAVALPSGLAVVPGAASGEGCSLEGGCASCPYMKMNSLSALMRVCERVGDAAAEATLAAHKPRAYSERVGGRSMAAAGCVPILHMRGFQKGGALPEDLVADIRGRHASA